MLSPEAIAMCRVVDVSDFFAEHSTVTVGLHIPLTIPSQLVWQRPSRIPWDQVDSQWTSTVTAPTWTFIGDVNKQWAEWASSFESSLKGHVQQQPGLQLQASERPYWH